MARLFICGSTGTGLIVEVPVTPYLGADGETVTTRPVLDAWRPDCPIVGPAQTMPIDARGPSLRFLVRDEGATVAPAGTYDLGDPTSTADMGRTLSNPEANAVADVFADVPDVTNRTFRGMTLADVAGWAASNQVEWVARFIARPG